MVPTQYSVLSTPHLCLVGLRASPEVDAAVGVGRQGHRVPRRVPVLAGLPDLNDGGLNIISGLHMLCCGSYMHTRMNLMSHDIRVRLPICFVGS